jgi:formylglycine-generating enzyme required for sulfatase activity
MSGNVWEWTSSWYDLYYYSVTPQRNPQGPEAGLYKVIRGGGWLEDDSRLGSVYLRNFANPDLRSPTVGFRCAKSAPSAIRE